MAVVRRARRKPRTRAASLHTRLTARASRWLTSIGCKVAVAEIGTWETKEIPDAIGWSGSISTLVEVKTSRGDFLGDANKPFRKDPTKGMGSWRTYLVPPGIVTAEDCPPGWSIYVVHDSQIRHLAGPRINPTRKGPHHQSRNVAAEMSILVSAVRRERGHYDKPWGKKAKRSECV